MADKTMYAWTPIRNGGESDEVRTPNGGTRNVITSRNVIAVGEKVTPKDVAGGNDPDGKATFDQMVEAGSIRPYPFPKELAENPDSTESPLDNLRRTLREAAEAQLSEEQQLLLATGSGAVVSDEVLVESQPKTADEVKTAANTK